MAPITLALLPAPLGWDIDPLDWRIDPGQTLRINAGQRTDLVLDPRGAVQALNASQAAADMRTAA